MRRHLLFATLLGLLVLAGGAASAQPSDPQLDECLDVPEEELFLGPPTCTFDAQGNLVSRTYPGDGFGGFAGPSLGTFLFLALVWAGVPLLIAGAVANNRGESVGLAVVLTLILGWIGLVIVLFGLHRTSETLGQVAAPGVAATRSAGAPTDSAVDRLRQLEDLRSQGLITDAEFDQRRNAVLDGISDGAEPQR